MKTKIIITTSLICIIMALSGLFIYFSKFGEKSYKQDLDYTECIENYLNPDQGFYRTACISVTPTIVEDKSYIIKDDFQIYHLCMDISAFSSVVNNNQDLPLTDSAISQIENLIN